MKELKLTSFVLSFLALGSVDTEATPLWGVLLILAWFAASVFWVKTLPDFRHGQ